MKLREVQEQALDAIIDSFKEGGTYHLLQAPVGYGKTILSSALMDRSHNKYGAKCLFLAHLRELVLQTVEKLSVAAPGLSCGVYMGARKEKGNVIVGTRQTVEKNLDDFDKINLLIVDECHLWSPSYQRIVDALLKKNPRLRVLGVTGTPYNGKGWLYGEGKLWPDPCYSTTIDKMIELGYLSPFRYKLAESEEVREDLAEIPLIAGEYNESMLGELMKEDRHIGSVSKAIEEHCEGRERIMVFAVTIDHAEALAEHLACKAVHSKLKKDIWRERVDEFKDGKVRVLVNVSQLSVGFDCPEVDALIVARPTLSTALHVQICGRALRISDGKKDALIIDLCGNYAKNGLPSRPRVYSEDKDEREAKEAEARAQICPECLEVVEEGDICPFCGAEMTAKVEFRDMNEKLRLKEIEVEAKKPKLIRWHFKDHVTAIGSRGVMFVVHVTNRSKPLFRFCGEGTKKLNRTIDQLKRMKEGESLDLIQTAYGTWIA